MSTWKSLIAMHLARAAGTTVVAAVVAVPSKCWVFRVDVCQDSYDWHMGCREWREKPRDVGDKYIYNVNFHKSIMYRRDSSYSRSKTIALRYGAV